MVRTLIIFIAFLFVSFEVVTYLLQDNFRERYGPCSDKGMVLSKDEIIREATSILLKNYPPNVIRKNSGQGVFSLSKPDSPIYYKNLDEFFTLNPDCCHFVWMRNVDEGEFGLFNRLSGRSIGYVVFNYKVRFKDGHGDFNSLHANASFAVTSCGFPVEKNIYIKVK